MKQTKEIMISKIEEAREKLNQSVELKKDYNEIYHNSVELDHLINQYIVAGF